MSNEREKVTSITICTVFILANAYLGSKAIAGVTNSTNQNDGLVDATIKTK